MFKLEVIQEDEKILLVEERTLRVENARLWRVYSSRLPDGVHLLQLTFSIASHHQLNLDDLWISACKDQGK